MEFLLLTLSCFVVVSSAATFGCTTPNLADVDREMFQNAHNDARRSIAKGTEPNKCGLFPTGKNIYDLNYDCNLEQVAYNWASKCSLSGLTGINASYIALTSPVFSSSAAYPQGGRAQAGKQLNTWWSSAQQYGIPDTLAAAGGNTKPFETMANAKVTGFACAYAQCFDDTQPTFKYKWAMACIYNNALAAGDKIYETGPACAAAGDCTYIPGSTCNDGLCHTDSMSGPPEENNLCPAATNMNDEIRMAFVNRHNELKSSGVKGLEPDGAGGTAPKGKQSLKYKWDCDIEANAISWGNTCALAHSTSDQRKPTGEQWGENLFQSSDERPPKQAAIDASNLWWKELADFGVGQANILDDATWARGVGHYTQMAWETTYKLGCSVNYCSGKTWVVCQYGPTGNWMGELIYTKGDPCTDDSGCPSTYTCSVSEGLCVVP